MLKKTVFNVESHVKLIIFMNNFYKHIFRSNRLLLKISAPKIFAILRIIRDSNTGAFV